MSTKLLALTAVTGADAAWRYTQSTEAGLCAAADDAAQRILIGPLETGKDCTSDATVSSKYIISDFGGSYLLEQSGATVGDYLTDSNKRLFIQSQTPAGKIDTVSDGPAEYAFAKTGAYVGGTNSDDASAWVGHAHYIMLNGKISTNVNNFPVDPQGTEVQGVCIVDYKDADLKECGDAVEYKAGAYKFSVFGGTMPSYAPDAKYTHFAHRQLLDLSRINAYIKINGAAVGSLAALNLLGTTQVNSLEFGANVSNTNEKVTLDFPQKFTEGTYAGSGAAMALTPVRRETVLIRVSSTKTGADWKNELAFDFIFPLKNDTLKKSGGGGYYVYDPTYSVKSETATGVNPHKDRAKGAAATADAAGVTTGLTAMISAAFAGAALAL